MEFPMKSVSTGSYQEFLSMERITFSFFYMDTVI